MGGSGPSRTFLGYLGVLIVVYLGLLSRAIGRFEAGDHLWATIALTVLLAVTERAAVSFHEQHAEFSLSAAEAVLLVMFASIGMDEVLVAVTIAHIVARLPRWRRSAIKESFNLAQYSLAAVIAAYLYRELGGGFEGFTIGSASIAALVVVVFAVLTHTFVSLAVALAEKQPFLELSRQVAPATVLNLAGSIIVGLLFTASFHSSRWTIVLFPFVLATLFLGYRAVLRQQSERKRVEHLHQASRVLASSPDLGHAVEGFLQAVAEIVSGVEARVMIRRDDEILWSGTRLGEPIASLEPVSEGPMASVFEMVSAGREPLIAREGSGELAGLLTELDARMLLAVPLVERGEATGCLIVLDRLGPEGFGDAEVQLLDALGSELTVTLDSHRLFHEIAEERERFGRIFTGSKEGICLLDSDGCVRAWNPAMERITGHAADSVMGQIWSDTVVIRDRSESRLIGDELVGVEPDEELELVTRSGPSRWITTLSSPVGEVEDGGWVVLIRDVTAEHEVEAAKSDFLSTISHELRTPLTTIKGSLQVLSRGPENLPPDLAGQMIGVTTRGAERLERLVMNLLAVSQIESGTMPVFPDALDLGANVQDCIDTFLKDHPRKRFIAPDRPLVVRADRERMSHIVEHLLENAQKFGGPEGEIVVEITHEAGFARLSVTDEGPGIASTDQERIFDRFVRLGDVLTRETQGAGIGLFIAKRSVEAMGGRIWVESKLGEGATFHVTVPMARPMAVADEADSA